MSQITSSITVQFDSSQQGFLSAEIDSRPDGLNRGRSQFKPGDVVWLLVYASPLVTYGMPILSEGSILRGTDQIITQSDVINLQNTAESKLSKPASSALVVQWYGNNLGAMTLGDDKMSISTERAGVAVAKVKYSAKAQSWGIQSPPSSGGEKNFSIGVLIIGSVKDD
ncbi:hypothetical protein ACFQNF_19495 [Iodobacter arcticus]|uniref:Uncharacterized protein n=1 Tax=Iodobacter arcticus TaxID=590593 RepID=A0ABW2R6L0_9NEIS